MTLDLGTFGVWWSGSWHDANDRDYNVAGELESLDYGTLWSSGGFEPGLTPRFGELLDATAGVVVASGIVSIWTTVPADIGPAVWELGENYDDRFLLGIGASHSAIVQDYARPYTRMVEYLDALDALERPVPPERRILAALGPRMLRLAKERAVGAHPYFVPVEHTAYAREELGAGPVLAPEVAVVLETDRTAALELARRYASIYLPLPNYTNNLRRFGYTDADIDGGGSDRLIEAVIPWGDAGTVAARLRAHIEAGADHVCVQVVADFNSFPITEYRALASALFGG
ncbi:MAG TPA: TIGR03620 family F420-dependent LLM class oxidoreductase [Acidimicrobiales bacterium]|jgi:probable F420-dependent oxidoreductase